MVHTTQEGQTQPKCLSALKSSVCVLFRKFQSDPGLPAFKRDNGRQRRHLLKLVITAPELDENWVKVMCSYTASSFKGGHQQWHILTLQYHFSTINQPSFTYLLLGLCDRRSKRPTVQFLYVLFSRDHTWRKDIWSGTLRVTSGFQIFVVT